MKRFWVLFMGTIGVFLLCFVSIEAMGIPILQDPTPWMEQGKGMAAVIGIGLLVFDALIPVPSSLIMIAHGAIFGVVSGTALSLVGGMGASAFAYGLGRSGSNWVQQFIGQAACVQARKFLQKWGSLAVILSRPIPLLSESVALMAGSVDLSWSKMMVASLVGLLPICLVYAYTGAFARSGHNAVLSSVLVMLTAGVFWGIGQWMYQRK